MDRERERYRERERDCHGQFPHSSAAGPDFMGNRVGSV